ncbi:MAG: bile acid:sodium symporter family protein [Prevotella sp.]|nr:bile acid:sodium symporter family protein [Prevotella sp.]
MKRICSLIADYMGLLVLAAAVLAVFWPESSAMLPARSTLANTSIISPLLGVIMFGMGLTLKLEDFRIVFSRPKDIVIGCLAQFTVMPLLAWMLARLFALDEALTIGVVLVGCCPGGTASNVITYLSRGDLALSVGMTGVSTLVAPLLTPLLVWLLAGKTVDVDVAAMFLSILWVVILPIVIGLVIKSLWSKFTDKAVAYLPALSSLTIATLVFIVIAASSAMLAKSAGTAIAVVILHNICGLAIGYLIGYMLHLAWPKRKALSIEVGMQNSGLASSLATLHFAAYPMAIIPGALFSVWHNISGALIARLFCRLSPSDK